MSSYSVLGDGFLDILTTVTADVGKIATAAAPVIKTIQSVAAKQPIVAPPSVTVGQLAGTKSYFGIPLGFVVVGGVLIAGGLTFFLIRRKPRRR